jgi:hypothetical protein
MLCFALPDLASPSRRPAAQPLPNSAVDVHDFSLPSLSAASPKLCETLVSYANA